jgi:membrane protease YdiL (CAAX protease family)
VLGFGLCLLYRATGSLYPCIAAHCVNNSLAFGSLENWDWQIPVLMASSLLVLWLLALALSRAGVTSRVPATAG